MIVTCPNCETQFNVDDAVYSAGRKARCSVCQYMFILPAVPAEAITEAAPEAAPAPLSAVAPAAAPVGGKTMTALDELLAEEERKEAESAARAGLADSLPHELAEEDAAGFDDTDLRNEAPSMTPVPAPKKGGCLKRLVLLLALLLCLGGLSAGVYLIYFQGKIELPFKLPFGLSSDESAQTEDPVGARIADIDKVKDLLLIDVSHKYVQNVKLGPLVVITGKVKNNFSTPKEMIRVEASLLDKKGKVLATQQQYAGIVVPDLQLQVLGQKELAAALDNRFDMLANNINVQPGVEVPFMVVFVYPPSNMAEYTVIVSHVSDPPNLAPQQAPAQ